MKVLNQTPQYRYKICVYDEHPIAGREIYNAEHPKAGQDLQLSESLVAF